MYLKAAEVPGALYESPRDIFLAHGWMTPDVASDVVSGSGPGVDHLHRRTVDHRMMDDRERNVLEKCLTVAARYPQTSPHSRTRQTRRKNTDNGLIGLI